MYGVIHRVLLLSMNDFESLEGVALMVGLEKMLPLFFGHELCQIPYVRPTPLDRSVSSSPFFYHLPARFPFSFCFGRQKKIEEYYVFTRPLSFFPQSPPASCT